MTFEEILENLRLEYFAAMAAECQGEYIPGLLDRGKVEGFPPFYDFLLSRGWSRHRLSAHGIGRDIAA